MWFALISFYEDMWRLECMQAENWLGLPLCMVKINLASESSQWDRLHLRFFVWHLLCLEGYSFSSFWALDPLRKCSILLHINVRPQLAKSTEIHFFVWEILFYSWENCPQLDCEIRYPDFLIWLWPLLWLYRVQMPFLHYWMWRRVCQEFMQVVASLNTSPGIK